MFTSYFVEAGFDVLAVEGISVPFDWVGQLSWHQVYAQVKRAFLDHRESAGPSICWARVGACCR